MSYHFLFRLSAACSAVMMQPALAAYSIQIRTGRELKTLAAAGEEVTLFRANQTGDEKGDEGEYKRYPYEAPALAWRIARAAANYTIQVSWKGAKCNHW